MASGASRTRVDARCYWVLLSMVPQVGPARFQHLLDVFGEAEAAWRAGPLPLARAGLDRRAIEGLAELRAKADPAEVWQRLERLGVVVMTLADQAYPEQFGISAYATTRTSTVARRGSPRPSTIVERGGLLSNHRWQPRVSFLCTGWPHAPPCRRNRQRHSLALWKRPTRTGALRNTAHVYKLSHGISSFR
jgi:hypothetical protein